MGSLQNKKIKDSYKDLLQVSNENKGIDDTLRSISDGEGTESPLKLSSTNVSFSGNVGIGTTSPDRTLHILDSTNDGSGGLKVQNYKPVIELSDASANATATTLTHDNTKFTISNNSTDSLTITSTGNVGIGTTNPSGLLSIFEQGEVNTDVTVQRWSHSDADSPNKWGLSLIQKHISGSIFYNFSQDHGSTSSDVLTFNKGNVGIGTTSPDTTFQVAGSLSTKETNGLFIFSNSSSTSIGTSQLGQHFIGRIDSDNYHMTKAAGGFAGQAGTLGIAGKGGITFGTCTTSEAFASGRMIIDVDGNVGIGTESPNALLHLSAPDTAVIRLENSDTSLSSNQLIGGLEFEKQDPSGAGVGVVGGLRMFSEGSVGESTYLALSTSDNSTNNAERMRIDSSGNVGIGKAPSNRQKFVVSRTFDDQSASMSFDFDYGNNAPGYTASGLSITNLAGPLDGDSNADQYKSTSFLNLTVRSPGLNNSQHGTVGYMALSTPHDDDETSDRNYGTGQIDFYIRNDSAPYSFPNSPRVPSSNWMSSLMTIKSDGNVGIGTNDPDAPLDLGTKAGQKILLWKSNLANDTVKIRYGLGVETNDLQIFTEEQAKMSFGRMDRSDGETFSPDMTIDSNGNVGIGTSSPNYLLDLEQKDGGVQLQMGRTNTNAGSAWMGADANGFHLGVGAYGDGNNVAEPNGFTVDKDGKIGIGINDPKSIVHVKTTDQTTNAIFESPIPSVEFIDSTADSANDINKYIMRWQGNAPSNSEGFRMYQGNRGPDSCDLAIGVTGNVGIGDAKPSKKLSVAGDVYITGDLSVEGEGTEILTQTLLVENKNIILGNSDASDDDTANGGGIILKGETDKSILFNKTNTAFDFSIGATFDGNVGIGKESPDDILDINSDEDGKGLRVTNGTKNLVRLGRSSGDAGYLTMYENDVLNVRISSNNGTNNYLNNGGNFGIGTDDPKQNLTIGTGNNSNSAIGFRTNQFTNLVQIIAEHVPNTSADGKFHVQTRKTGESKTRFTIDEVGNVGIGTSNPDAKLHVYQSEDISFTGRTEFARWELKNNLNVQFDGFGDSHSSRPGWFQIGAWNNDTGIAIVSDAVANIENGSSTNGIFIKNGNVGIGTTSPDYKLHVVGGDAYIEGWISRVSCYHDNPNFSTEKTYILLAAYDKNTKISGEMWCGRNGDGQALRTYRMPIFVCSTAHPETPTDTEGDMYARMGAAIGSGASMYTVPALMRVTVPASKTGGVDTDYVAIELRSGTAIHDSQINFTGHVIGHEHLFWDIIAESDLVSVGDIVSDYQVIGANMFQKGNNIGIGTNDPQAKLDVQGSINVKSGHISGSYGISNEAGLAKAVGHSVYHIMISSNFNTGDSVRSAAWYVTLNHEATDVANVNQVHVHNNQTAEFYVANGILKVRGLSTGNNRAIVTSS